MIKLISLHMNATASVYQAQNAPFSRWARPPGLHHKRQAITATVPCPFPRLLVPHLLFITQNLHQATPCP